MVTGAQKIGVESCMKRAVTENENLPQVSSSLDGHRLRIKTSPLHAKRALVILLVFVFYKDLTDTPPMVQ